MLSTSDTRLVSPIPSSGAPVAHSSQPHHRHISLEKTCVNGIRRDKARFWDCVAGIFGTPIAGDQVVPHRICATLYHRRLHFLGAEPPHAYSEPKAKPALHPVWLETADTRQRHIDIGDGSKPEIDPKTRGAVA